MNLHQKILTFILAGAVCLASACTSSPAASILSPTPAFSEGDIRTQAVVTVLAGLTASAPVPSQTASITPQPSSTSTQAAVPTENTPVPPTATRPVVPTPTITYTPSQNDFVCEILSQDPAPDDIPTFEIDDPFDLVVTLKNTGDNDWPSTHFTPPSTLTGSWFMFINGKYMQEKGSAVTFVSHTQTHHDLKLVVDLTAPDAPGTYTANYAMFINNLFFCPVHFTIKVK